MRPEYTVFMKEQFSRDPNQSAKDVWKKFTTLFGEDIVDEVRVALWWHKCCIRSLKKQPSTRPGSPGASPPQPSPTPAAELRDLGKDLDGILGSSYALDGNGANYLLD